MKRTDQLVQDSFLQVANLISDDTPAVTYLGSDKGETIMLVLHDYWPSKNDRPLALGQAATAEMTVGGNAAAKGARFGVLWAHVVVPRAALDFSDETGLSWRRLDDEYGLDYRETEALLGFIFDIDEGFEISVVAFVRSKGALSFGESHIYESASVREPLPGLILMRTVAENAPVREYQ